MKSAQTPTLPERSISPETSAPDASSKDKEETANQAVEADKRRAHLAFFQTSLRARKGLLACGAGFTLALHESDRLLSIGADRRGQASLTACCGVLSVLADGDSAVALTDDGQVHTKGRTPAESEFAARISGARGVSIGRRHMAVLMVDGRVRVGGDSCPYADAVESWADMTAVACGANFTAGLCADGHVMMAGGTWLMRDRVSRWENMSDIVADPVSNTLYGLGEGGVLYATRRLPTRVRAWKMLVQFSAWGNRLCAVTSSGQLLSTFFLPDELTTDARYIAVAIGRTHLVALTRTGELVAYGDDRYGQCRTAPLGRMFTDYELFTDRRRTRVSERPAKAYAFRVRAAETVRFSGQLACSERVSACINAYHRVLTQPCFAESKLWQDIHRVSCGNAHILGLRHDGSVLADGNNCDGCCDVSSWTNIRRVEAGSYHSLGVTFDGRVYYAGADAHGRGDVGLWTNIRTVRTADTYTVGLDGEGRLYVAGEPPFDPRILRRLDTPVTDVCVTNTHALCLFEDGRVLATRSPASETPAEEAISAPVSVAPSNDMPSNENASRPAEAEAARETAGSPDHSADPGGGEQEPDAVCKGSRTAVDMAQGTDPALADWREIASIAAYDGLSVGLRYGGTVCAVGVSPRVQTALATWRGIVAVGCGDGYVVGLGHDGHLRVAGRPAPTKECRIRATDMYIGAATPMHGSFSAAEHWQDIIAFACAPTHLLALNRDGQVLACGSDSDGQCSVTTHFTLFRDARSLAGYGRNREE